LKGLFNSADYFENLFWGAGHVIQIAYVQILIFAWLIILGKFLNKDYKIHYLIAGIINIASAFIGMLIIFKYPVETAEYKIYYTKHMIMFTGLSSIYIALITIKDIFKVIRTKLDLSLDNTVKNCLTWSIILYAAGGFIGLKINEINTVIPAHYHGSIIAISLGAMGLCYLILKQFGYNNDLGKAAKWQPALYGFGQLVHIIGFAMSGGYGALRKSPGTLQSFEGKFYMGLMGLGGLISIIGGLIFIIVIFKAINFNKG